MNCLRDERIKVGLSLSTLSEKSGIPVENISRIENTNVSSTDNETAEALATALETTPEKIFPRDNSDSTYWTHKI